MIVWNKKLGLDVNEALIWEDILAYNSDNYVDKMQMVKQLMFARAFVCSN